MKYLKRVWCRMDNRGICMGCCTNYEQVSEEQWKELLAAMDSDDFPNGMHKGHPAHGWDDPRGMEPIEGEWTDEYAWVKKQMEEWNMDTAYSWEFFEGTVPLEWALQVGIVWEDEVHGEEDLLCWYDYDKKGSVREEDILDTEEEEEAPCE